VRRKKEYWLRAIGIASAAVVAASLGSNESTASQSYPSRPITMVVPFAAGGGIDILGRILAEHMRARSALG
jgi:tripartite-type tricarboxylate transporter receptor subunit TctC